MLDSEEDIRGPWVSWRTDGGHGDLWDIMELHEAMQGGLGSQRPPWEPCDTWELIEDVVQVDRYKADSYHPFSNQMGLL